MPKKGGKGKGDLGKTLKTIGFGLSPESMVGKLIKDWKPRGCKTEKDFENSLYRYFEKNLSQSATKQYGLGRVKADITFGKDVAIELKKDFKTTAQYQRLIGQIEIYKREFESVFVVLCGKKTDQNLVSELKKKYESDFDLFQTIKVIVK